MYIDESGDLGFSEKSSKFIVISALVVKNPKELDRIIKNMRRHKFQKQLKKMHELKAYELFDNIKFYMLKKLNSVSGAKVFHVVLEKKKVFSKYLKEDKHKLYNFIAGKLAKNILMNDMDIEIKIDKSKGNILLRKDFNDYFKQRLEEGCDEMECKIEHSYSHSWSGLQFADLLAWSCFQKYEKENSSYLEQLKIEQEFYVVWR
ncbi:MAG: DUF3800 domain-containing protein [Patescibacteria group bacterium]